MQVSELEKYIQNPRLMNAPVIADLQKLVNDFPYFQSAHILLSLAAKKWDASVYQQSLKKTAVVVSSRSHLYKLIHDFEKPLHQQAKETAARQITESIIPPVTNTVKQEASETKTDATITAKENAEDIQHELNILKATELSTTPPHDSKPQNLAKEVEKEMGKHLVNAFIQKEVLKTTELHSPEKKLETPVSFGDWLIYLKNKNPDSDLPLPAEKMETKSNPFTASETAPHVEQKPDKNNESRKQKNRALIDRIIESNPGLIRVREEQKFFVPDTKAKESLRDNEHLVTETLARIYALQGNISKAIRAYEILSLKFPQKSAYFAGQIQKLKSG